MRAKTLYFATVAFLPIVILVLEIIVFWPRLQPLPWVETFIEIAKGCLMYSMIGTVVIIVDLWRSQQSKEFKICWTVLIVFLCMITLPVYWCRHINRRKETAANVIR